MTDEGANAQGLSIQDLQKHINELREEVKNLNEEYRPLLQRANMEEPDEDAMEYLRETLWRMHKAMHYSDALIAKLPLDRSVYEDAARQAEGAQSIERATVYLDRLAQRFPEFRGGTLRGLASMYSSLKNTADNNEDEGRAKLFSNLAEQAARDAVAADHAPLSYVLLAEILIEQGVQARLDEAESLLHEAETHDPSREEQTLIELGLGNIAIDRKQDEEALAHFQHAADISPDYPGIWYNVGHVQFELKQYADAEQSLKRALEDRKDLHVFTELASVYMSQQKDAEAREILEQGLRLYPQSASLRALLAAIVNETGDRRRALSLIGEAERLSPDLEIVKTVRQIMNKYKKK
jgi:tetratricopeptide (TPR) repeat protein